MGLKAHPLIMYTSTELIKHALHTGGCTNDLSPNLIILQQKNHGCGTHNFGEWSLWSLTRCVDLPVKTSNSYQLNLSGSFWLQIAVKMIWGRTRCHVLGVKGHRRSNFKNQNFQGLIADLDSLWKSMTSECASFFLFSDENPNSAPKSPK